MGDPKKRLKKIVIDGTTQSHRAFPPEWYTNRPGGEPPEIIEMDIVDQHGRPLVVKPNLKDGPSSKRV